MSDPRPPSNAPAALLVVKAVHTLVWAGFAGCILAIPLASWRGRHALAAWLSIFVAGEVLVLVLNRMSCPLTAVAARYTADRRANFDIFLPLWLAQYNKPIFGTLYLAGLLFTLVRWISAPG